MVAAVGAVSEALEWVERARGRLYDFHQMMGRADLLLGEARDTLEEPGHGEHAARHRERVVGRDVLPGRWTFQVVEEFDDGYRSDLRAEERRVREALAAGRRHVHEAEKKQSRRSRGRPGHEATPDVLSGD